MTRLHAALLYAVELHAGQDREGDSPLPYLHHPLDVCHKARWLCGCQDEDVLCATLLHDALEECACTLADLDQRFGPRTAGLVGELTRREPSKSETRGLGKEEVWRLRTTLLLEEIRAMSPPAQMIKLCDRLSNLGEAEQTRSGLRLHRYIVQSRLVLRACSPASAPPAWDALDARVAALERLLPDGIAAAIWGQK